MLSCIERGWTTVIQILQSKGGVATGRIQESCNLKMREGEGSKEGGYTTIPAIVEGAAVLQSSP